MSRKELERKIEELEDELDEATVRLDTLEQVCQRVERLSNVGPLTCVC